MRVLLVLLLLLAMLFTVGSGAAGQEAPATDPAEEVGEEPQEFEPTERVPADTAISFPVDI